jgi:hypothetical protein
VGESLPRLDAIGSLQSLALNGISMSFPRQESPNAAARESRLISIIDDCFDSLDVDTDGNVLTLEFTQPRADQRVY